MTRGCDSGGSALLHADALRWKEPLLPLDNRLKSDTREPFHPVLLVVPALAVEIRLRVGDLDSTIETAPELDRPLPFLDGDDPVSVQVEWVVRFSYRFPLPLRVWSSITPARFRHRGWVPSMVLRRPRGPFVDGRDPRSASSTPVAGRD